MVDFQVTNALHAGSTSFVLASAGDTPQGSQRAMDHHIERWSALMSALGRTSAWRRRQLRHAETRRKPMKVVFSSFDWVEAQGVVAMLEGSGFKPVIWGADWARSGLHPSGGCAGQRIRQSFLAGRGLQESQAEQLTRNVRLWRRRNRTFANDC